MDTFPIPDAQTDEAITAHKRFKKWQAAVAAVEKLESERSDAVAAVRLAREELRDARRDAAMRGHSTSRQVEALTEALRSAEAKAEEPWSERIDPARDAAAALRSEYAAYVDQHFEALHLELTPEGEAARERIVAAVDELAAAFAGYESVARRATVLARLATFLDDRDVAAPPTQAPGKTRRWHAAVERVTDPTGDMRAALSEDPYQALPVPLVAEHALQWRRDKRNGVERPARSTDFPMDRRLRDFPTR